MAAARKRKKSGVLLLILFTVIAFVSVWGISWWKNRKASFIHYPAFGIPIPRDYSIHGIDVSRYQEHIAWEEVQAMQVNDIRIGFAFIKATEGIGNVDKYFRRNWRKSKDAGITRGAYHFFIAAKDGRMQAEHFIKTVDLDAGDLPPVLDVEQAYGVSAARIREEVKKWLNTVEEYYGQKPLIYTNIDFYERYLGSEFDSYPLWIAHYFEPNQPRISRDWIFWQHSEQGRVNGIAAKVDFNVFNGDSASFRKLLRR